MESLGYTLLYLLAGSLPWSYIQASDSETAHSLIATMKNGKVLSDFAAPFGSEFIQYFEHVRSLGFEHRPDYTYLRGLFRRRMKDEGWACDWAFDWVSPENAPRGTLSPSEYKLDKVFLTHRYVETF